MAKAQIIPGGGIGLETYRSHFDTNESAKFTNGGDVAATWTWNTGAGRLEAVGGTQALLTLSDFTASDFRARLVMTQAESAGLAFRVQDANNYYLLAVHDDSSAAVAGSANAFIHKRVGGAFTQIGSYNGTWVRGDAHSWEIVVSGTSIKVFHNGVQVISVTDATFVAPGPVALRNNSTTAAYFDAFSVNYLAPSFARPSTSNNTHGEPFASGMPRFETPMVTTTNLLTENQSSAEVDLTGWAKLGASVTFVQSNVWSAHGNQSVLITNAINQANAYAGLASTINVTNAVTYQGQAKVYNPNAVPITVSMSVGGGSAIASKTIPALTAVRIDVPYTAPSTGTTTFRFWETTGQPFHVDCLQLEQNNHATGWVPGGVTLYQPDDGEDHFVEGTRNTFVYSQEFNSANWAKTRSAITANVITAPDGTLTADLLTEDTTASQAHYLTRAGAITTADTWTVSVFAKMAGRRWLCLDFSNSSRRSWFDLQNGVVGSRGANVLHSSIYRDPSWPEGWYRCTATTVTVNGTFNFILANVDGNIDYTGDGVSGVYLWGAQAENKPYATSYRATGNASTSWPNEASGYTEGTVNHIDRSEPTNIAQFGASSGTTVTGAADGYDGWIEYVDNVPSFRYAYKVKADSFQAGETWTFSAIVKMDDGGFPVVGSSNTTGDFGLVINNNTTGTIRTVYLGNGLYRVSITHTFAVVNSSNVGVIKYSGQSSRPFKATAYQLEQLDHHSAYLKTTGSVASRYERGDIRHWKCEEGTTNLLTANQSSVETDTTGFVGESATGTRDTTYAWTGSASLKVVTSAGASRPGIGTTLTSVSVSTAYAGQVRVLAPVGEPIIVRFQAYTSGDAYVSDVATASGIGTGAWQTFTVAGTTPPTGAKLRIAVREDRFTSTGITFYVDGLQIEQKAYATSWTLGGTTRSPEVLTIPTAGVVSAASGKIRGKFRIDTHTTNRQMIFDCYHTATGGFGLYMDTSSGATTLTFRAYNSATSGFVFAYIVNALTIKKYHTFEVTWSPTQITVSVDGSTPTGTIFTNGITVPPFISIASGSGNTMQMDGVMDWMELENSDGSIYRLDFTEEAIDPEVEAVWISNWRENKHRTVVKEVELISDIPAGSYVNMRYAASVDGTEANLTEWTADLKSLPDVGFLKYKAILEGKPLSASPKLKKITVSPM